MVDQNRINSLTQTKDPECHIMMSRYISNISTQEIKQLLDKVLTNRLTKDPYQKCKNIEMYSGNSIYLYSEDQLILYKDEIGDIYCFDTNDIGVLIKKGINPFTDTKLTKDFVDSLRKKNNQPIWPLDMSLQILYGNKGCYKEFHSKNENTLYFHSTNRIKNISDIPNVQQLIKDSKLDISGHQMNYIYKIDLDLTNREPAVKSLTEVYNPFTKNTENNPPKDIYIDDEDLYKVLKFWTLSSSIPGISSSEESRFIHIGAIPNHPVRVYRGISYTSSRPLFKNNKEFHIGDKFTEAFEYCTSWTTNYCVAENFQIQSNKGLLIETMLNPEDIVIDLRRIINTRNLTGDGFGFENEIISKSNIILTFTIVGISYPTYNKKPNYKFRTDIIKGRFKKE